MPSESISGLIFDDNRSSGGLYNWSVVVTGAMARMCMSCCVVRYQIHPLENITDDKAEGEEQDKSEEGQDLVSTGRLSQDLTPPPWVR